LAILRQKFESRETIVAGTSAGTAVAGDYTYGEGHSYGYYYFNADLKPVAVGEPLRDDREGDKSYRYSANGAFVPGFGFLKNVITDTQYACSIILLANIFQISLIDYRQ